MHVRILVAVGSGLGGIVIDSQRECTLVEWSPEPFHGVELFAIILPSRP